VNAFVPIALARPGVLGRLFGRTVKDNAYREIQNLLAATPAAEVPDGPRT
jgi:hypothetical protein